MVVITVVLEERTYELEFEPEDGVEVLKFQIYSLTDIPPDQQRLTGLGDGVLQDSTDLCSIVITERQRVVLNGELVKSPSPVVPSFFTEDVVAWQTTCTRVYFGPLSVVQPRFCVKLQQNVSVCYACANTCFVSGQVGPVALASPESFACMCTSFGECLFAPRYGADVGEVEQLRELRRSSLVDAAEQQVRSSKAAQPQKQREMAGRIESSCRQIRVYEDVALQAKARLEIPLEELSTLVDDPPQPSASDELLRQLLHWFKRRFFKWCNAPACQSCNGKTKGVGGAHPTPEEARHQASRVEVYKCKTCGAHTRFPRYNDPAKLLQTRVGRCGEWANVFTLCCRALGFETRYVMDWTDHVWTEVWSEARQRWLHCDPCEDILDRPVVYERGWGKKLTYIVAFGNDHVTDVTRRYTNKWPEVLARRTNVSEAWFRSALQTADRRMRETAGVRAGSPRQLELDRRCAAEEAEFVAKMEAAATAAIAAAAEAKVSEEEKRGRISGNTQWKAARGEMGGGGGGAGGLCASTLPEADAAALPPPPAPAARDPQLVFKERFGRLFSQLTTDCVRPDCDRARCGVSVGDAAAAAALALKLLSETAEGDFEALFCPSVSSSSSGAAACDVVLLRVDAVGGRHDDSVAFDDGSRCASLWNTGHRLRVLKVWASESLVSGVQAVFGRSAAGAGLEELPVHMGRHDPDAALHELRLESDEWIVEIGGSAGALVDSLFFVTSRGRRLQVGNSSGGEPFRLRAEGGGDGVMALAGLHGGVGGHLHSIGCYFAPAEAVVNGEAPVAALRDYDLGAVRKALEQLNEHRAAVGTVVKYLENVVSAPLEPRVRSIRAANAYFQRTVAPAGVAGRALLEAVGFVEEDDGSDGARFVLSDASVASSAAAPSNNDTRGVEETVHHLLPFLRQVLVLLKGHLAVTPSS